MTDQDHRHSRRDFLIRGATATAAAAGLAAAGFALRDPIGPTGGRSAATSTEVPDFRQPRAAQRMCVARGSDRARMARKAIETLGGMGMFVDKGDRVLLKVNAAFASPPVLCATSHPDLVREIARLCWDAGASAVYVTDNPINDPASCFRLTGIERAAAEGGARLVFPSPGLFRPLTMKGGRLIRQWPVLLGALEGVNRVIGLTPLKDHHRSGASMTMKNWYGLLGGRRHVFHQDIHGIIQELAVLVRPTLVILDCTMAMVSNGPTGGSLSDLKPLNTLVASTDQVAADACGAQLLGLGPADLPFLSKAEQAGAGRVDYRSLKPAEIEVV
jgi:uncharacterized protein (DUF362 family)